MEETLPDSSIAGVLTYHEMSVSTLFDEQTGHSCKGRGVVILLQKLFNNSGEWNISLSS
jgi:hypothetical protein